MSSPIKCSPSRALDFLNIGPDEFTQANEDLFVGKNKNITLTFPNGSITSFRDVVILGKLTIQAANKEDSDNKPKVVARDIFNEGNFSIQALELNCRNITTDPNLCTHLQEIVLEWQGIQREAVAKAGLKPIL